MKKSNNKSSKYRLDKKTGHLLETPSKEQVRKHVKEIRKKEASAHKKQEEPKKVFHKEAFDRVQKMIDRLHAKAKLPDSLTMARRKYQSTVCVINREGKKRELLGDKKGRHVMLCHRKMASIFVNQMCIFAKIQKSFTHGEGENSAEEWHDGSWSICPCKAAMTNRTTIQEVRRRPWFFLHRYWYEITFDGHVQPAMMFSDYNLHPELKKKHFYVTREYIKVRNQDAENDYLRFWLNKPTGNGTAE